MDAVVRVRLAMLARVRDFLRAHPFGEAKADQVGQRFVDGVARAFTLQVEQEEGVAMARSARSLRDSHGRKIRDVYVRFLATVSRVSSGENPELAAEFRLRRTRLGLQDFRTTAQVFLDRAKEREATFLEHGLPVGGLAEFEALLGSYDNALAAANGSRRAHTGARRELQKVTSELVRQVKVLDALVARQVARDPKLAGAWASARNTAWPARGEEVPAEPKVDAA